MENTLEITVIEEDIYLGEKCSPRHCPISKAFYRMYGVPGSTGPWDIGIVGTDDFYLLPTEARVFLRQFDRLGPIGVKPISFVVSKGDPDENH